MTKPVNVRIEVTARSIGSHVWVEGREITNVRYVELRAGVGECASLWLELVNVDVEVVGTVDSVKERQA